MDEIRARGGKKAAIVAVSSNCFLTVFNIIVGLSSGSYGLVSEGVHTLSDVATSLIAYIGFRVGLKSPDDEHLLGHGRAEAITGLIIVIFLAVVAIEVILGAVDKITHPELITVPSAIAAIMAVFGIFVNYTISEYIIKIGKEIKSPAIVADGKHQKVDIFSSVAVLIGVIASNIGYPILDPIVGLLIGALIIKTAAEIALENIDNIMGKVPSPDFVEKIEKIAYESSPEVRDVHETLVDYAGSYAVITLHVAIDENFTLKEAHEITAIVRDEIEEKIPESKFVTVHADPYEIKEK